MKTLKKDLVLLVVFVISALMIMCSKPERQMEYTYTAEFDLAAQVDLGDPLFYEIDRYYVYASGDSVVSDMIEANMKFYPNLMAPSFVGVFYHDSLFTGNGQKAKITFKSEKHVSNGIVFASGSNRFNNTRFSAGQIFNVRIEE